MPKASRKNKFTFWRERRAGRCEAPRRSRCRTSSRSGNKADARPPPRPFGLRPAGALALLLAPHIPPPGIARRSRLASGPGGQQQNMNLFLREPLMLVIWRRVLDVDDLFAGLRQDRGKRILFYQLSQSLERLRIISGLM